MAETTAAAARTQPGAITKDDIVGQVLERYPQTIGIFLQSGFTPLKDPAARRTFAAGITIEQATRMISADLDALLGALNKIKSAVDASTAATAVTLPITKSHLVGEVTEAYPATLQVFLKNGFAHLADETMRKTVARTVTIQMASTIHGLDLASLLAELNAAAGAP